MEEAQFETARRNMVDCQIRPTKVTDKRVLEAFGRIPREAFVDSKRRALAYVDEDLPVEGGRCMMEPMVLARLVQALEVEPSDNVLVLGGGTGYATAIMSSLAASVIMLETRNELAEHAQETLVSVGIDNAVAIQGDLVKGFPQDGPYEHILIEGAVDGVPQAILEQIADEGALAAVWRPGGSAAGVASLWTHAGEGFARKPLFDAQVPLIEEFRSKREFEF